MDEVPYRLQPKKISNSILNIRKATSYKDCMMAQY